MRFCDFFIEYKTRLKEIPKYIPWVKLPLYRKIGIVALFICFAVVILLFIILTSNILRCISNFPGGGRATF